MATKLIFRTQPDGAVVSTAFTQQPVAWAVDDAGALDTAYTGTVTIAKKYGTASLSGTAAVAASGGIVTWSGLSLGTAGRVVLEITASGLTAARSGCMTVMPAATAAKTVLSFTKASTRSIDCGSAAGLDDLTASNMTLWLRVKRTDTGTNQFLFTKDKTFGEGWYVNFDTTNGEGTVVCGALTTGTEARSFSNSSNLAASGTWYDLFCEWVASSKTWKIYLTAVGTASVEVSGYNAQTAGTGSMVSDAAAKVFIGYLEAAANLAPGADIEWAGIFAKGLTAAERLQVQQGGDLNNKTDAAAAINNVGSVSMLHRLDATGTLTDLSGNGNSGTVSGATTTTGETVYSPTVWGEAPDPSDLTTYKYPGSHGKLMFSTSATSVIVGGRRVFLQTPTNDNQAAIAFEVNGAYDSQLAFASIGAAYGTRSLPAGSKALSIINSASFKATTDDTGTGGLGAGVISLRFNASATEVIPPTPSQTVVVLSDSMMDGFLANPVGQRGPLDQLRMACAGNPQIVCESYGGRALFGSGFDSAQRALLVTRIAKMGPTKIVINLGVVDYGDSGGLWTAANFETAYSDLLAKLIAECPRTEIFACSMMTMISGEGANASFSNTATQYRTAIANAVAANPPAVLINGPTQVWDGSNVSADSLHPGNAGCDTIYDNLKVICGIDLPFPHRQRRFPMRTLLTL